MEDLAVMRDQYRRLGFALCRDAVAQSTVAALRDALDGFADDAQPYGERKLMARVAAVAELAQSAPLSGIATELLGNGARPVRSLYFDKPAGANWNVAWHQDTGIAVNARVELDGFGPWSRKRGVVHVEPPLHYLQAIVTLRLHLDPTGADNGALRVIPGSHARGRLSSRELLALVDGSVVHDCEAMPGDVLVMSPLLLHSSRKALRPSHRRVVHIEYSAMSLPPPLRWSEALD